jgi:hypothetical protein
MSQRSMPLRSVCSFSKCSGTDSDTDGRLYQSGLEKYGLCHYGLDSASSGLVPFAVVAFAILNLGVQLVRVLSPSRMWSGL